MPARRPVSTAAAVLVAVALGAGGAAPLSAQQEPDRRVVRIVRRVVPIEARIESLRAGAARESGTAETPADAGGRQRTAEEGGSGQAGARRETDRDAARDAAPTRAQKPRSAGERRPVQRESRPIRRRITVASDVLFDYDRADLGPSARAALRNLSVRLRQDGARRITVVGHTDSRGQRDYNLQLSRRRALAVRAFLASTGSLDGTTITAQGRGESEPVAPNRGPDGGDDPAGRRRNRRVNILYVRERG